MRQLFAKAVLIVVSLLLAVVVGEIVTRLGYRLLANYNTEMWRYAAELKQPLPFPNLPFHHRPNAEGTYYGVKLQTNSLGLRDREYQVSKPAGTTRIMMLGDSFTLGWGVPFEETFSKRLEEHLRNLNGRYEVLNMGVGNYNSIMEVELFKRKGMALNPDVVVLMYFVNDTEPTPVMHRSGLVKLLERSYLFSVAGDAYIKLRAQTDKRYDWIEYYRGLYAADSPALVANRNALRELMALCKEKGISLLIVSIPELRRLKDYPFPMATQFVREAAAGGQVPFLDLLGALENESPDSLWVTVEDPHANGKANAIIAQAIFRKLTEAGGALAVHKGPAHPASTAN